MAGAWATMIAILNFQYHFLDNQFGIGIIFGTLMIVVLAFFAVFEPTIFTEESKEK